MFKYLNLINGIKIIEFFYDIKSDRKMSVGVWLGKFQKLISHNWLAYKKQLTWKQSILNETNYDQNFLQRTFYSYVYQSTIKLRYYISIFYSRLSYRPYNVISHLSIEMNFVRWDSVNHNTNKTEMTSNLCGRIEIVWPTRRIQRDGKFQCCIELPVMDSETI